MVVDERGRSRVGSDPRDAVDLDERRSYRSGRISPRSANEVLQPERVPPPPPRSRAVRHPAVIFLNFVLTVLVVAMVAAAGGVFFAKLQFERAGPLEQPRVVQVARGTSLSGVAKQLEESGIISNRWVFWIGVRLNKQESNLKAGEYLISPHASMQRILDDMVSGKGILYQVTIPEGLTSRQIVDRLNAEADLEGTITEIPPEGSLLPETYKFSRGDSRASILARMRRDRDRLVAEIWGRRVEGLPIGTPEELVTLASIVEKETGIADERSRVAAVFINRLNRDMRLQSDPTVIYGIYGGSGKPSDKAITRSDLDAANPYNTYQVDGLPPGPIANPGRAALEAVANPSRTKDIYFVADGTGGHVFATTFEEHRRNVVRWRQVEARKAKGVAPPPTGTDGGTGAAEAALAEPAPTAPVAPTPPNADSKAAKVPTPAPNPDKKR